MEPILWPDIRFGHTNWEDIAYKDMDNAGSCSLLLYQECVEYLDSFYDLSALDLYFLGPEDVK